MDLGVVYLHVTVNKLRSIETCAFTVGTPPQISEIAPRKGDPGTRVTLTGTGFGSPSSDSSVLALSAATNSWTYWPVTSWNDTEIVVPVPDNTPLGNVYLHVMVNKLQSIETWRYTVGTPPTITAYSPTTGPAATVLTINGIGFGSSSTTSYVLMVSNSNVWTMLTPSSWTDTQIVVTLPPLTAKGWNYLYVGVNGLQSIETYPFLVQ
jgi:hypothetical protein